MSEEKANSKPDCSEEVENLEALKCKLIELEKKRAVQTAVKTVGMLVLAALFSYVVISLYSSYKNFNQEEYTAAVQKELNAKFDPRLKNLNAKSEKEIFPLIRNTVTDILEKKMPHIEQQIKQVGERAETHMRDTLAKSLESMLLEIETNIKKEIGDDTFDYIIDNKEFEEMVAEEVYAQLTNSEKIVESFRVEIEYLKQNNPEIMKMAPEKAEKLFVTSVLDLMKYGVSPELGETKEVRR